jgi:hypothetical protein
MDRILLGTHIRQAQGAAADRMRRSLDGWAVRPAVYRALRSRLRPYIVGEMPWDVVYTSVLLTHCRAELVNRWDDCRHAVHDTIWIDSPFAPYAWRRLRYGGLTGVTS